MSLFFLTEPSLDLAVASAMSNCQLPTPQDDDSDILSTCSTFLPLPMKDCVLEVPPSLLSCVPLKPIRLSDLWESLAIDLEDLEDFSSVVVAPAEFAVPACAFWSPKFDFECDQLDDVSTCAPSSPSSVDFSDDSSDDFQENLSTDRKAVWWRRSQSGDVSARSTSSKASFAVPRSNSTSSICSSSTSSRSSSATTRSNRFLHKAKDLFCEMVAFDEKCSNSLETCCTTDVAPRPIVAQLQPLNGCMPRFPSCDLGSPISGVAKRAKPREAGSTRGCAVPRVFIQTEAVKSTSNANTLTGVGACANSVLAVSPVGSSKTEFCKLLREVLTDEVLTFQQGASVRFPTCKP